MNTTKTTSVLEGSNMIGLANEQRQMRGFRLAVKRTGLFSLVSLAFQHSDKSIEQECFYIRGTFSGKTSKACLFWSFQILADETSRKHLGKQFYINNCTFLRAWHLFVFSRSWHRFMFSRTWSRMHVFPLLVY